MSGLCMAVIGAGSTYTPELIEGLICRRERLPLRELRLMDIDARKNEIVGNFAERMLRAAGIAAKVVRTEDLRAALEGVDLAAVAEQVSKLDMDAVNRAISTLDGKISQMDVQAFNDAVAKLNGAVDALQSASDAVKSWGEGVSGGLAGLFGQ